MSCTVVDVGLAILLFVLIVFLFLFAKHGLDRVVVPYLIKQGSSYVSMRDHQALQALYTGG